MIEVRRDAVITGNKVRDEVVSEIRKGRKRWKEKKWTWKAVAYGEFLFVF